MSDIAYNYNDKHIMVALCKLKTAKDRAKYVLAQLAKNKNTTNISKCLSYEAYEEVLANCSMAIQGSEYYMFNNKFILEIINMNSFAALKNLYNNSVNKNTANSHDDRDDVDVDDDDSKNVSIDDIISSYRRR